MIELVPTEPDDAAFLVLIQRIVSGAVAVLKMHEVYVVHVDNWFDYKWLGWWSNREHEASWHPSRNAAVTVAKIAP